MLDPTDNRSFGWALWCGYIREEASGDFISAESEPMARFCIDPDTYVVKELWISMNSTTESSTSPTRQWGYMVVMEEVKITPSQSIFQQIKGMAQNVG